MSLKEYLNFIIKLLKGQIDGKADKSSLESTEAKATQALTKANSAVTTSQLNSLKTELEGEIAAKISEPTTEGTSGQVLTTDGAGGRTWTTVSSSSGGSGGASFESEPLYIEIPISKIEYSEEPGYMLASDTVYTTNSSGEYALAKTVLTANQYGLYAIDYSKKYYNKYAQYKSGDSYFVSTGIKKGSSTTYDCRNYTALEGDSLTFYKIADTYDPNADFAIKNGSMSGTEMDFESYLPSMGMSNIATKTYLGSMMGISSDTQSCIFMVAGEMQIGAYVATDEMAAALTSSNGFDTPKGLFIINYGNTFDWLTVSVGIADKTYQLPDSLISYANPQYNPYVINVNYDYNSKAVYIENDDFDVAKLKIMNAAGYPVFARFSCMLLERLNICTTSVVGNYMDQDGGKIMLALNGGGHPSAYSFKFSGVVFNSNGNETPRQITSLNADKFRKITKNTALYENDGGDLVEATEYDSSKTYYQYGANGTISKGLAISLNIFGEQSSSKVNLTFSAKEITYA